MANVANTTNETTAPDPSPLFRLIARTRRVLRSSWVAVGVALTIGLGLGTLAAVTTVDLLAPLMPALRLIGLLLIVVPTVAALVLGVLAPLVRRMSNGWVARRIESKLPGIKNRLVSTVDLARSEEVSKRSPAFYARLVREALERVAGFRPAKLVDWPRLRRAALFGLVGVVAFLAAFGVFSDRLPTAMARIFNPFADIPPATGVEFEVKPGDAKFLRGDEIPFAVTVTRGRPDDVRLELRPIDGSEGTTWYDLDRVDETHWTLGLVGMEKSFHYRVHGGGTWSTRHKVYLLERPTITDVRTVLHYPEYMAVPEPPAGPPGIPDVTGPEGSAVEVVATATGDVAVGEIQWLDTQAKSVEVTERPERVWQLLEFIPQGIGQEGNWQWDHKLRAKPAHHDGAGEGHRSHRLVNAPAGFTAAPTDMLFAYVYIPPDQKPAALMLEWHDGRDWEHRAYWGEDKFGEGKPDTPSRRRIGPMPEAGGWVRLEVPAARVGMAGKDVRGIGFREFNGQAFWHRAGAVPPTHVEKQELVVATTYPMKALGEGRWAGRFPLNRTGAYRVELRNELGHANKMMKEARAVAIPDNPPQIVLERPGTDLTLSAPRKVPIVASAYDDFGLADLVISTRKGDTGGFVGRPIKKYGGIVRNDSAVVNLDLAAYDLKPGEFIRYRVETRDRKGQSAQTQEFTIRIADDGNSADRQLENFARQQETFQEKLANLIAEQKKVQEQVKALPAKFEPLKQKIAEAERKAAAETAPKDAAQPKEAPEPQPQPDKAPQGLDADAKKMLDELRGEMAKLAGQEEQNTRLAEQVAGEIKNSAERAAELKLLPPEVLNELQQARQAFDRTVQAPLGDLAGEMRRGADGNRAAPNVEGMNAAADQIQRNLDAMKARMEAINRAEKAMNSDAVAALEELRRERQKQEAELSARDLQALRDFIAEMREEMKRLEGNQEQVLDAAKSAPDILLPDVQAKQEGLDRATARAVDDARALQNARAMRAARRRPEFPDRPHDPDAGEELVAPDEDDMPEDAAEDAAKDRGKDASKKSEAEKGGDEEEMFLPALGGPRPKIDPRFADKIRPVPKKDAGKRAHDADAKGKADHPQGEPGTPDRGELQEAGAENLRDLDMAEGSLASDQQSLERMLERLREAMNAPDRGQRPQAQEGAQADDEPHPELDALTESEMFRQAQAMAERMRQMREGNRAQAKGSQRSGRPHEGPSPTGNLRGTPPAPAETAAVLKDLDLNTRTIILKMPPRVREELLQGMREEGPEGYAKYIQDYFKRLTEVKPK